MTETKFTPGPWRLTTVHTPFDEYANWYHRIEAGEGWSGNGFTTGGIISPADAHLIAAAPELYAALEAIGAPDETDLVSVPDSVIRGLLYATINIAKDALAKARGEA